MGAMYALGRRFQPTLPARGETVERANAAAGAVISTHSPRTGRDQVI